MAIKRLMDSTTSAYNLRAVTPHASNDLPDGPCRALWVGTQGDISVVAAGDTDPVPILGAVGLVPVAVKAVRVSGTDATNIVALY